MKTYKKCKAYVKFKNGDTKIIEYKLDNNLSFGLEEMEKWVMEQEKDIENIKCYSFREMKKLMNWGLVII